MRSHFEFPDTYISKLASKARKTGNYTWNKPISAHLPDGRVMSDGKEMLMLAGYSYLGHINNTEIRRKSEHALDTYGLGTHGTRPNCGSTDLHTKLESLLAKTNKSESATLFPSGFQANFSTISALVGKGDVIIGDEFNHASIVDGCNLSAADFVVFKHNNLEDLENKLKGLKNYKNRLIIVDAVFSMDGDVAPIPELCKMCDQYKSILMVDEAHSFGVFGNRGFGITEHFGMNTGDIDVITGVLSKAIPGTGGYACGSNQLNDFLKHNANSYIFSGSLSPYSVAIAISIIEDMFSSQERLTKLWQNQDTFHSALKGHGIDIGQTCSPITPIILGDSKVALKAGKFCMDNGIFLVPVPFPLVPIGKSRLRATVTAEHVENDLIDAAKTISRAVEFSKKTKHRETAT